ncbi:MAG: glycoside hydrolase family 127 protein [Anaerolineae bacterium]|nr:glycoside hydrolase family 127 protein [Anaerolineae bacterium]
MMYANPIEPVALKNVTIDRGFWGARIDTNRRATLPIEYEQLKKTGRIEAWKLDWNEGKSYKPHRFWDSDSAKWIEAAAYSLTSHPDEHLEALVDEVIDLIEKAQQPDGYLNIFYTAVEPENRWANLRDWHELYCAGHLIEAAVAYYQVTGKRKLLDVMIRYAKYIDQIFGPNKGQKRGYPGHQEIELALVKLYRVTGQQRYLNLAKFFIDERGQQPPYFDLEARARGEDPVKDYWAGTHKYNQSHVPVREQTEVVGHAVRACYMYAGMADVAAETNDPTLVEALQRLWQNVTEKRMYITGGIGPTLRNEGFTFDYDLPNDMAYAETCAAIALVFWAHRMFHLDPDRRYIDVLERALYNGVLSGVSLDGTTFFYANPLAAFPEVNPYPGVPLDETRHYRRSEWFDCACCPPNLARLLANLGQYVYSTGKNAIYVHLYTAAKAQIDLNDQVIQIEQQTNYPWDETVRFAIQSEPPGQFTLALRLPGWCRQANIKVNGQAMSTMTEQGYARIDRTWQPGDQVELTLSMPLERIETHPRVRQNAGRFALQRGPVVYCLEEVDNGPNLAHVIIPRESEPAVTFDRNLLGGVSVITGQALRRDVQNWPNALYRPIESPKMTPFAFKAIPYCFWANRQPGEMQVWLREG